MKDRSLSPAPVGVHPGPPLPSGSPPANDQSGQSPLLKGCIPLPNQVAGHRFGVHTVGIFQHPDGTILKQLKPSGQQEMQFYSTVYAEDCCDPCLLELQHHLPKYYGTCSSTSSPTELYLKLEDVTRRFIKPCIMDVKLGRQTYDPFASREKREHRIRKYPLMKEMGFVVLGMRIYEACSDSFDLYDKSYGRGLSKDTVKDGLAKFFHSGAGLRKDAVLASIQKVRRILRWFESQHQLVFYASSLLFVYEGFCSSSATSPPSSGEENDLLWKHVAGRRPPPSDGNGVRSQRESEPGEEEEQEGEGETERRAPWWDTLSKQEIEGVKEGREDVEVRMIDFAHTFSSDSHDHGYTYGLKHLLAVLEQILHGSS